MSGKNQFPLLFNWQTTNPAINFLPLNMNTQGQGSTPSGIKNGIMTDSSTIYTQILDVSRIDNQGLEVTWTGNPTGTFQVMCSNSGINFYSLTFSPTLNQPSGSPGGYVIDLNQLPFKYVMLQYQNTSGTGVLTVYAQQKDLN